MAWATAAILVGIPCALSAQAEMPASAKPGECYARVVVPPQYSTTTEQVIVQERSSRIEIVPARYEWFEGAILAEDVVQGGRVVHPAGTPISPEDLATLRRTGRVSSLMTEKLEPVPPTYEWVTEQVMVKPAQTVWKQGRGPIERVDHATGEILCLVEEPATYRTVRRQVEKTPATTRTVTVPAEYKIVKMKRLVAPSQERIIEIPAKYDSVTRKTLVKEGRVEWRSVLCETNLSRSVVRQIQSSLNREGFSVGDVDGVIGPRTLRALESFQRSVGLAPGHVTLETLSRLGVRL